MQRIQQAYWLRAHLLIQNSDEGLNWVKKSLNWAQKVEMKLVDGMSVDLLTWNK